MPPPKKHLEWHIAGTHAASPHPNGVRQRWTLPREKKRGQEYVTRVQVAVQILVSGACCFERAAWSTIFWSQSLGWSACHTELSLDQS